jgi:hypothetical protein
MDLRTAREHDAHLFEKRLNDALNMALAGQTALVIVPARNPYMRQAVLTRLTQLVPADRAYQVRMPGNELHFEGTRGSVRVYSADTHEYDAKQKHMRSYPHGIPVFLHPEVEGL